VNVERTACRMRMPQSLQSPHGACRMPHAGAACPKEHKQRARARTCRRVILAALHSETTCRRASKRAMTTVGSRATDAFASLPSPPRPSSRAGAAAAAAAAEETAAPPDTSLGECCAPPAVCCCCCCCGSEGCGGGGGGAEPLLACAAVACAPALPPPPTGPADCCCSSVAAPGAPSEETRLSPGWGPWPWGLWPWGLSLGLGDPSVSGTFVSAWPASSGRKPYTTRALLPPLLLELCSVPSLE
jgi:hypothetical protein